jgi:hypothetical protein
MIIVVTDLNTKNDWFTFLKGSHRINPPFDNCARVNLRINASNIIVWSGDLRYIYFSGSRGKFITLIYL